MNKLLLAVCFSLVSTLSVASSLKTEVKNKVVEFYKQPVEIVSASYDADEMVEDIVVSYKDKQTKKTCTASLIYITSKREVKEVYRSCK